MKMMTILTEQRLRDRLGITAGGDDKYSYLTRIDL